MAVPEGRKRTERTEHSSERSERAPRKRRRTRRVEGQPLEGEGRRTRHRSEGSRAKGSRAGDPVLRVLAVRAVALTVLVLKARAGVGYFSIGTCAPSLYR